MVSEIRTIEPLKVAVIGAGLMGHWHAHYARSCGARVCGIADIDQGRAARLAGKFPKAASATDLDELLRRCNPQAVHVCTPTRTHEALVRQALDCGLSVLVEKPMAGSAETTARLLGDAKANHRLLVPAHQFVFQEGTRKAKAFLGGRKTTAHVQFIISSAGGDGRPHQDLDALAADVLPHPFSLLAHLLPGTLESAKWSLGKVRDGEWLLTAVASEVSVSILISFTSRPTECSMRIQTADGTAHLDLFHGFSFCERGRVSKAEKIFNPFRHSAMKFRAAGTNLGRRLLHREFAYPGLKLLIERFYLSIRNGSDSPLPDYDIMEIARARDAILALLQPDRLAGSSAFVR